MSGAPAHHPTFDNPRKLCYRGPLKWLLRMLRSYDSFQAYDDRMVLYKGTKPREILYTEITDLKIHHFPYVYGHFVVTLRSGEKFRFTAELERNNYILDAITTSQPTLVQTKQLDHFRQTMVAMDHSWARMEQRFKRPGRLVVYYLAMPIALTAVIALIRQPLDFTQMTSVFTVIALSNGVAGMLTYMAMDVLIQKNTRAVLLNNPLHLIRDLPYEEKANRIGRVIHPLLTALLIYLLPH